MHVVPHAPRPAQSAYLAYDGGWCQPRITEAAEKTLIQGASPGHQSAGTGKPAGSFRIQIEDFRGFGKALIQGASPGLSVRGAGFQTRGHRYAKSRGFSPGGSFSDVLVRSFTEDSCSAAQTARAHWRPRLRAQVCGTCWCGGFRRFGSGWKARRRFLCWFYPARSAA